MISFVYKKTKTFLPLFLGILFTLGGTAKAQSDTATYQKNLTYQQITVKSEKNISLKFKQKPIAEALEAIAKKVDAGLYFNTSWLPEKTISLTLKNVTLGEALHAVLKGTGLEAYASGRNILLRKKEIKNKPVLPAVQQETITGTVTDAQSGETLPGVNILVKGTSTGTSTDANGEYELTVESLQDTLVFTFIGYQRREVSINGRRTIDIAMQIQTISGEEMVVTGVGVTSQKKRLGQSVSSVDNSEFENEPVSTVSQILQGNVPGLVATPGGEVGSAAPIQIRGSVSLSQGSSPLVYIDGIRMSSSPEDFGSMQISELSQINKENIANIQVLKGASAATLYGTEASNGVILITTKEGQKNQPTQWTLKTTQGGSYTPLNRFPKNYAYDSNTDQILSNFPQEDYFKMGYRQVYNLSARGGTGNVAYFASANYENVNGSLPTNGKNNMGFRVNLNMQPLDDMEVRFGINMRENEIRMPYPSWGLMGEFVLADPRAVEPGRPYGELYHSIPGVLAYDNNQNNNVGQINGAINYQFTSNLSANFSVGYIRGDKRNQIFVEPGPDLSNPEGFRTVTKMSHSETTVNIGSEWNVQPTDYLSSTLNVGGQSYWKDNQQTVSGAQNFPIGSISTLAGATTISNFNETFSEVVSAGIFAQEEIGFKDRLFLTAGVRLDGNSTFGSDFGFETYPHIGLSWNVTDEPFWGSERIDQLRLRSSWGTSGLQPGVYDALRTWEVSSLLANTPVLLPNSFGNENLKPERSTEFEIGSDIGLFNKLDIDFTYYWQRTDDAIVERNLAPSRGFLQPQVVNVGELRGRGFEVMVDWNVLDSPNFGMDISGSISTRNTVVEDLGGVPPFIVGGSARNRNMIKEGYAPGAVIAPVLDPENPYELSVPISNLSTLDQISANYLRNENGDNVERYLGNEAPKTSGSFGVNLDFPKNLSLSIKMIAAAGFVMHNETEQVRVISKITPNTAKWEKALSDPSTSNERRRNIAGKYAKRIPQLTSNFVSDADYLQLQSASLKWEVPNNFLEKLSIKGATMTLGGYNLWLLTKYDGIMNPGGVSTRTSPLTGNIDYFGAPSPTQVQMSLRITF